MITGLRKYFTSYDDYNFCQIYQNTNQPIIVDLICYYSIMLNLNYLFMSLNSHTVLYHKPMTEDGPLRI